MFNKLKEFLFYIKTFNNKNIINYHKTAARIYCNYFCWNSFNERLLQALCSHINFEAIKEEVGKEEKNCCLITSQLNKVLNCQQKRRVFASFSQRKEKQVLIIYFYLSSNDRKKSSQSEIGYNGNHTKRLGAKNCKPIGV